MLLSTALRAQDPIPFQSNGLWGYKDSLGLKIIPAQYNHVGDFYQGYAIISIKGKKGVITLENELVVPAKYEHLRHIGNDRFLFGYRTKYLGEFDTGIIDTKGNVIIEPEYYSILPYKKAYRVTKQTYEVVGTNQGMDTRKIFNKYGLFSYDGKMIIEPKYDEVKRLNDTLFNVVNNDSMALFHLFRGQLTEFRYKGIGKLNEGLINFRKEGRCGYINTIGEVIIPSKYESCGMFLGDLAKVKIEDKTKFINSKDSIVHELDFKSYTRPYKNQFAVYDGKWGVVDTSGQYILLPTFERREAEYQGITFFANDKKWQLYDYDNQKMLDPLYDEVIIIERNESTVLTSGVAKEKKYTESLALVKQGGKWGIINEAGVLLVDVKYALREISEKLNKYVIEK